MTIAPFRIQRPALAGVTSVSRAAKANDGLKEWTGRLVKLIPSEAVAVYLAGRSASQPGGWWPVICLGLVIAIRIWGTRDNGKTQWIAVLVTAVSFVIWVYATGGMFLSFAIADPLLATRAMLVWTVLAPILYKGD